MGGKMEHKLERIEYDADPERCQGVGGSAQCPYKRVEGSQFCQRHGGNKALQSAERGRANMYRVQLYEQRLNELAEHDRVKSLRDEIAILRILMEETLNKCTDKSELLLYSGRISELAMKLEKLVTSCNKLEEKMGMLLDKSAALALAGQIVNIISTYVTDADIVDKISMGIIEALGKLGASPTLGET
jgi:hypothetical protein